MSMPPELKASTDMHIEKAEIAEAPPPADDIEEAKAASVFEANAIGYKEYREGLSIEITKKEVSEIGWLKLFIASGCPPANVTQNSRVRWKIDLVVLLIFLVTQALQFMDKTALNYANLFGYQETLGLHGQQFNYLSASEYAPITRPRAQYRD
ncbi:Major Facilitator Superfamily [Aspergillus sclerotialis]|uniref:Major Facilitator Superfamily n=1 Tax=Aspergillus sclerotialis TaxID=2070753 RepID=A0A3A2Z3E6_9EURO|nr:Major Facilitator Superfamily [Aspergillus sclerotialis]